MATTFSGVEDKINFASEEDKTLAYWNDIDAFAQSLKFSEGRPEYTFYDGPPFATGMPHYGYNYFSRQSLSKR
jgi:isoleucyl-tRNA synthetase